MLTLIPLSSLEKVFHDEAPQGEEFTGCAMLIGEEVSFQVAFRGDEDTEVTPLLSGNGAARCKLYWVEEIPSGLPCYKDSDDDYLRKTPGPYPDLLRPVTGSKQIRAGEWHSLWMSLRCEETIGGMDITVALNGQSVSFHLTQIPQRLPEQSLLCTNWFHCDCIAQAHGVEPFSEAYWPILQNYIRCAAAHGINFLLTPLFTPPLDTMPGGERLTTQLVGVSLADGRYSFDFSLLGRWFTLCRACGIKAFELSHLFTQWGALCAPKVMATVDGEYRLLFGWETDAGSAEYTDFLTRFAAALLPFLEEQGVKERCYVHVSDEPGMKDIETYARRAALIKEIFPGLPMIDALSDFEFYQQGLIERPIPANNHIEPFIGRVPELWTYYCCGQHKGGVANRFFAMPSHRSRVLGIQLWKFRCAGFLQWGYNFWNSQFSLHPINPFECSDAGGAFPSGDAYVVYPGEDGAPLCSLRLKVFHEALQDMRALQLLEETIGYDAALALVEEGLDTPISFSEYPRGAAWLLGVRERVNRALMADA